MITHIILVPFFEAKRSQLEKHIDFLKSRGFQVTVVNLSFKIDLKKLIKFGNIKNIWVHEIEQVICSTPGDKIIFSFSNPSAAAIEVIVKNKNSGIKGLICDSGPGIDFLKSVIKLLKHYKKIKNFMLLYPLSFILFIIWGAHWDRDLKHNVAALPPNFPVLIIAGGQDPLINYEQIKKAFEPGVHLNKKFLFIEKAAHLNGFKDFNSIYVEYLDRFLNFFN